MRFTIMDGSIYERSNAIEKRRQDGRDMIKKASEFIRRSNTHPDPWMRSRLLERATDMFEQGQKKLR
jgi:hypothetical protein